MGVKVIDRKYKNQFNSVAQNTDWLLGNVGDWQRLELTFEVSVDFKATTSETISVDNDEKILKLNNGKSWSDYGFDIGDTVELTWKTLVYDTVADDGSYIETPGTNTFVIQNLYGDAMETNGAFDFYELNIIPTDRGNKKITDVKITSVKEAEGMKFRYSHMSNENYQSSTLASFIDGTKTEFSYAGLNSLVGVSEMNPDGLQSGMAIKKATIEKISYASGLGTYKLVCDYMIASFFEDVSNFETLTAPSVLFNAGSLTDNFELEVFPEWNNPNTSIKNDLSHTERLGNTGWFNENFNGLDNNFEVEYVRYTDENGFVIDQLDYSKKVNVEILVSGVDSLALQSEFILGFAHIPQGEDYKNIETPFHENLFVNTGRSYTDGTNDSFNLSEQTNTQVLEGFGINGAKMNLTSKGDILFNAGGTDKVLIKASFEPNAEFYNIFNEKDETDRKYILWVSLANHNLAINFSDRVSLLLDYNDMIKIIPLAGEYDDIDNVFIEHPYDENNAGKKKYFGFIEDDLLSKVSFTVDKTEDFLISSMSFGYEVYNQLTETPYILEKYSENLSMFPKNSEGVQEFLIDKTRGFKTAVGNKNNFVKINRYTDLDDRDNVGYKVLFASKMRWEDWLIRDDVPNEFFNTDLGNNGYHNNWLDYLRNEPAEIYSLRFFVFINVFENGELKRYKNTYDIDLRGYDENLNILTDHKYFNNADDTLINVGIDDETGKPLGAILNDEKTRIEVTFTNQVSDFDGSSLYGVIGIELYKGAGEFEFRQLSSIWPAEVNNPLEPLEGESLLTLEQTFLNEVKLKCLVNPVLLEEYYKYKITARIGCYNKNASNGAGKYENKYENKYE